MFMRSSVSRVGTRWCLPPLGRIQRHFQSSRPLSATSKCSEPAVSDTISEMLGNLKKVMREGPDAHPEQYEGVAEEGLRMLVFGKPGSGKGTLSARLVEQYDISFVSTGDVLRKEIMSKSDVGKKAEEVVASGGLVSDELMLEIVMAELDRLRGKSWIVDGFPRTLHQGELLDQVLNKEGRPLNMIVHLNVPDSVIMGRIAARWVHLPSGRVYNSTYSAPKVEGKDDITGEPLSKRPDDTPATFSKRLQAYYESTAPLLEYFSQAYPDSLKSLSGSSSDEVLIAAGLKSPPSPSSSSDKATVPDDNSALDQLWPQLQELVEPFGLRRRSKPIPKEGVSEVRKDADDLADPAEREKEKSRAS